MTGSSNAERLVDVGRRRIEPRELSPRVILGRTPGSFSLERRTVGRNPNYWFIRAPLGAGGGARKLD